jgi:hypothetical protein
MPPPRQHHRRRSRSPRPFQLVWERAAYSLRLKDMKKPMRLEDSRRGLAMMKAQSLADEWGLSPGDKKLLVAHSTARATMVKIGTQTVLGSLGREHMCAALETAYRTYGRQRGFEHMSRQINESAVRWANDPQQNVVFRIHVADNLLSRSGGHPSWLEAKMLTRERDERHAREDAMLRAHGPPPAMMLPIANGAATAAHAARSPVAEAARPKEEWGDGGGPRGTSGPASSSWTATAEHAARSPVAEAARPKQQAAMHTRQWHYNEEFHRLVGAAPTQEDPASWADLEKEIEHATTAEEACWLAELTEAATEASRKRRNAQKQLGDFQEEHARGKRAREEVFRIQAKENVDARYRAQAPKAEQVPAVEERYLTVEERLSALPDHKQAAVLARVEMDKLSEGEEKALQLEIAEFCNKRLLNTGALQDTLHRIGRAALSFFEAKTARYWRSKSRAWSIDYHMRLLSEEE